MKEKKKGKGCGRGGGLVHGKESFSSGGSRVSRGSKVRRPDESGTFFVRKKGARLRFQRVPAEFRNTPASDCFKEKVLKRTGGILVSTQGRRGEENYE